MRLALAAIVVVVLGASAHADDDKALKPYAGQLVLATDTPPATLSELPAFLAANLAKDAHYELLKWDVNFVGVLAKDSERVTFVVADPADKSPLVTIDLGAKRRVVVGHFTPTKAAGFAPNKVYAVTLVVGKAVVAKAELVLD
jgi:hypothetical protein